MGRRSGGNSRRERNAVAGSPKTPRFRQRPRGLGLADVLVMQRRSVIALAGLTVAALCTSVVGCSSGDDSAPPAYATEIGADAEEKSQLRSLDISDVEPIVDETDPEAASESDLEENPL